MQDVQAVLAAAIKEEFGLEPSFELTRPDEQFGDFATNVAMQLAKQLGKPPRVIAEALIAKLQSVPSVQEASVAGPGFINVRLSDAALAAQAQSAATARPQTYNGQVVVAEYSDPNPFKVLHAGHLYTTLVGDAVARIIEFAGGEVHRTNFGGDVGLHVGKSMWAIVQFLGGEHPQKLAEVPEDQFAQWLSKRYIEGNTAYETDETAQAEIIEVNKRVYKLHETNDHDSPFAQIYWTCRQRSYDYFEALYRQLQVTPFEKYYPESQTTPIGLQTVRQQLQNGVYQESDGAVVFKGEPYGLHTRVFITNNDLPTYEAKDVGLIMTKWQDYHFDQSLIITANDIVEYMKVVLKSIEQFEPELAKRSTHLTHGIIKMQGGVKMSSRKGNGLLAQDVLDAAHAAYKNVHNQVDEPAVLGAVKYAFLKHRIGPDIIYDVQESVGLEGNSGPYIQYAHARARSILRKASLSPAEQIDAFTSGERSLVRKLTEYPDVVRKAARELMPHHICTYLYELAQTFNRFYEHNQVIGDTRESQRLLIVRQYADVLKAGLTLLGIHAPEKM